MREVGCHAAGMMRCLTSVGCLASVACSFPCGLHRLARFAASLRAHASATGVRLVCFAGRWGGISTFGSSQWSGGCRPPTMDAGPPLWDSLVLQHIALCFYICQYFENLMVPQIPLQLAAVHASTAGPTIKKIIATRTPHLLDSCFGNVGHLRLTQWLKLW